MTRSFTQLFDDFDSRRISRRRLLQGIAAATLAAPAASFAQEPAAGQGRGNAPRDTTPLVPPFEPTGAGANSERRAGYCRRAPLATFLELFPERNQVMILLRHRRAISLGHGSALDGAIDFLLPGEAHLPPLRM